MTKQNMGRGLTLDEKISIKGVLAKYRVTSATLARLNMDCACYLWYRITGSKNIADYHLLEARKGRKSLWRLGPKA